MSKTLFTDQWAVIGAIDPDEHVSSPTTVALTDAIDMALYDQVAFIVQTGNIVSAAGTVAFSVTQATTAAGTYKAVTSAAITTLTGSPTMDDKQAIVTVNQTALDMDNNYRFLKGSLTVGGSTGASDASVVALGRAKHAPASDGDLASVAEIVSV